MLLPAAIILALSTTLSSGTTKLSDQWASQANLTPTEAETEIIGSRKAISSISREIGSQMDRFAHSDAMNGGEKDAVAGQIQDDVLAAKRETLKSHTYIRNKSYRETIKKIASTGVIGVLGGLATAALLPISMPLALGAAAVSVGGALYSNHRIHYENHTLPMMAVKLKQMALKPDLHRGFAHLISHSIDMNAEQLRKASLEEIQAKLKQNAFGQNGGSMVPLYMYFNKIKDNKNKPDFDFLNFIRNSEYRGIIYKDWIARLGGTALETLNPNIRKQASDVNHDLHHGQTEYNTNAINNFTGTLNAWI